jgi:hypothetical protein
MTTRIQRTRKKGFKLPPNTVCITRPGKWGNPFKVGETYRNSAWIAAMFPDNPKYALELIETGITPANAKEAVEWFEISMEAMFRLDPDRTKEDLLKLKDKNLACWCKVGDPCHGDLLVEIIEKLK